MIHDFVASWQLLLKFSLILLNAHGPVPGEHTGLLGEPPRCIADADLHGWGLLLLDALWACPHGNGPLGIWGRELGQRHASPCWERQLGLVGMTLASQRDLAGFEQGEL